jgi:hypothetical protein
MGSLAKATKKILSFGKPAGCCNPTHEAKSQEIAGRGEVLMAVKMSFVAFWIDIMCSCRCLQRLKREVVHSSKMLATTYKAMNITTQKTTVNNFRKV